MGVPTSIEWSRKAALSRGHLSGGSKNKEEPSMWKLPEESFKEREQQVRNPEVRRESEPVDGVPRARQGPRSWSCWKRPWVASRWYLLGSL